MCAEHAREDVPEPPSTEQSELVTDGGRQTAETEHVEPNDSRCPVCGHEENEIVDTHVKGRGSSRTLAIKACLKCETLWGEPKEWYGVVDDV